MSPEEVQIETVRLQSVIKAYDGMIRDAASESVRVYLTSRRDMYTEKLNDLQKGSES